MLHTRRFISISPHLSSRTLSLNTSTKVCGFLRLQRTMTSSPQIAPPTPRLQPVSWWSMTATRYCWSTGIQRQPLLVGCMWVSGSLFCGYVSEQDPNSLAVYRCFQEGIWIRVRTSHLPLQLSERPSKNLVSFWRRHPPLAILHLTRFWTRHGMQFTNSDCSSKLSWNHIISRPMPIRCCHSRNGSPP